MAIKSKYGGRCKKCGIFYPVGTLIEKYGIDWYPVDCPGCARDKETLEIKIRLEKELLEVANIGFGCWGIPEGAKPTFTRREWIKAAKDHNVGTPEELKRITWYYAGLLDRDLSD